MFTKRKVPVIVLVVVSLVLIGSAGTGLIAQASPPAQTPKAEGLNIPYSGLLNNAAGQSVPDGAYDFRFTLFATLTGGEPLWTETHQNVAVSGGKFAVALGTFNPIPRAGLDSANRWLEVAVRRPSESKFTALAPRQSINPATPTAPTSLTSSAACTHDHLGEEWNAQNRGGLAIRYGNVAWPNGLVYAANGDNGPALWGVNISGGNAVRGDGYGTSIGVYGEGDQGPGVAGNSAANDGVSGGTAGEGKSGVYAHAHGAGFNYGLTAESESGWGVYAIDGGSNPDNSYALYAQGDIYATDDMYVSDTLTVAGLSTFLGGKSGYVVDFAQNDDKVVLEPGDVVVISGFGPALAGEIPVIKVRRASAAEAGAVVGVVEQHYVPAAKTTLAGVKGEKKSEALLDGEAIQPGEYLTVVTLGAFKMVKVDASYGAIKPGSLLTASPNPGYAMLAVSPQLGTLIGKALGALANGTGIVPVIVTLQ